MAEVILELEDQDETLRVLGPRDQHLRMLREALGVRIIPRDRTLTIEGQDIPVNNTKRVLEHHDVIGPKAKYDEIRRVVEKALS